MVGAAGFEPATAGLEIRCSIRLSYAPVKQLIINRLHANGITLAILAGKLARWSEASAIDKHKYISNPRACVGYIV